jgi:hypothetical protein
MVLTFALFVGTAVVGVGLYVMLVLRGEMRAAMQETLRNQAEAIARQTGDDVNLSVDNYRDELEALSGASNQVKSALVDLAYFKAKSVHGEERVTDQDVRLMLNDTLGTSTSDPNIIWQRVNDTLGDVEARISGQANAMGIEPPNTDLTRPGLNREDRPNGDDSASRANPENGGTNAAKNDPLRIR